MGRVNIGRKQNHSRPSRMVEPEVIYIEKPVHVEKIVTVPMEVEKIIYVDRVIEVEKTKEIPIDREVYKTIEVIKPVVSENTELNNRMEELELELIGSKLEYKQTLEALREEKDAESRALIAVKAELITVKDVNKKLALQIKIAVVVSLVLSIIAILK